MNRECVKQIDEKLASRLEGKPVPRPELGWVRSIREALGMTLRQMADRMEVRSTGWVTKFEKSELDGSLSLASLEQAAEALECELHYVLVPKAGTVRATLDRRASSIAASFARQANLNMGLEDSAASAEVEKNTANALAQSLLNNAGGQTLWDPWMNLQSERTTEGL